VHFLDGDLPASRAVAEVESAPHSRYPVTGASADDVLGFLHVRDLMSLDPAIRQAPVKQLVRPVLFLPDTVRVLPAMSQLRRGGAHLAIVRDEYGGTAGIVTLEDLVEELVGEIHDEYDRDEPVVIDSPVGLTVDGLVTLEQFEELTGYILPEGPYDTVAGFWASVRGEVPELSASIRTSLCRSDSSQDDTTGDTVEMTVVQMDGRRAARINVRVIAE